MTKSSSTPPRVGIAGLGRVGRGALRANYAPSTTSRIDICAVCDVMPIDQVAYLLAHDSTYGSPPFSVDCLGSDLLIDGKRIRYVRGDRRRGHAESEVFGELRELGLDVLIDATGTASIADLRLIIEREVAHKVLCTWNVAGGDISLVYGVNEHEYDARRHDVVSASTCTGNAVAPVLFVLDEHIGIDYARIVTIHPALSDQRVLDGYHTPSQLGRTCSVSIVPTSTNVAKSAALVLPSLEGKLDSHSYRVPTAIVSAMDIAATLSRDTTREECVELLEHYAKNELAGILSCDYGSWGHQKASIDYLGTSYSSIVLMQHLTISNGRQIGISLMHDNERAYCCRLLDILGVLGRTD